MTAKQKPFHRALGTWYEAQGRRDLPWRSAPSPYTVWVSEIMLQQTQVKTVQERFFTPFMQRFPTLQTLAEASEDEVLKLWQGLGYYSRARNMLKAAKIASPQLPDTVEGLLALPGIGRNTAHAILAFGYHSPYAVMEANVKRVICRLYALEHPTESQLWELAQTQLNIKAPFNHNQAMMDLGAMVCTPKSPDCSACPVAFCCKGKDAPLRYPVAKAAKAVPTRHKNIVLLQDESAKIYCTPRQSAFLGGLYGFVEQDRSEMKLMHQGQTLTLSKHSYCGTINHVYSHFRLEGDVYLIRLASRQNGAEWKSQQELAVLPISKADEKALAIAQPFGQRHHAAALATTTHRQKAPKQATLPSPQAAPATPVPPKKTPANR